MSGDRARDDSADAVHAGVTKAYRNAGFLDSRDARVLRILAEYLEPEARFERRGVTNTIVFFGSARLRPRAEAESALERARAAGEGIERAEHALAMSRYYEDARTLARRLSQWSLERPEADGRYVVCTGGGPGAMEAASRGARDAGAQNVGLSISLPIEEYPNPHVTPELAFEFHYFFMRKFWFVYLAKAVVAMPGGFGTLDELFELMTLTQTFKLKKRVPLVLYGREYWDSVIDFDAMVRYGTINAADLEMIHRTDSIDDAFEYVTRSLVEHAGNARGPSL